MEKSNQSPRPVIIKKDCNSDDSRQLSAAIGQSFEIHVWTGGGPDYLHVHYADDEAWHILEGILTFRFIDRKIEAPAGTTVFIPRNVPHTFYEAHGTSKYLMILTPRLRALIEALHEAPYERHYEIMRKYDSELLEE